MSATAIRGLGGDRARLALVLHASIAALIPLLLAACAAQRQLAPLPWANARQLVLVVTPDWNSPHGELRRYVRSDATWEAVGASTTVVVGRAGSAWGIGLHPAQHDGPQKREGDGRSPAGAFAIGTAFGYGASARTALPYAALTADDWCIDVDGSPLYNRIVDARMVGAAGVTGSSEPMRRDLHENGDQAYKLGFVIEHNAQGVRGGGSCIFAHLWKSADSSTAGCTAMAEPVMAELLAWLDPARHPVFVLLPREEYKRLRVSWNLPPGLNN